jgi:rod shape-determining protein MreD
MKRLIVVAVVLGAALLAQLTIINGLDLPGGGTPDLVLLCVVAIGLVGGAQPGLVAGFCAGLALDLAPPANELIGQYALVFCLVGYGSGRMTFTLRRSPLLAFATAAAAVVTGEALAAGLALVLDTPQVTLATVAAVLPSSVLYDIALSPLALFAAVKIAVGLGVSFNPLDDSPALERGGSAAPIGLAGLAGLRRVPNAAGASGGPAVGSGGWVTGDSTASVAAVGEVGWLRGPATSRRARREQARLVAALTGAVPRKGAFWVGSRPAGLNPGAAAATVVAPSGLHRLHPSSGVAGSATREGLAPRALAAKDLKIDFSNGGSHGSAPGGRVSGTTPRIAFGSGGLPGSGRASGRGAPRINFSGAGRPAASAGGGIGLGHGGLPASSRRDGDGPAKIAFGSGSLPGAGPGGRRKVRRIAFGSGLSAVHRGGTGRMARPRFRARSARSASGSWLAGSRLRSAGLVTGGPGRGAGFRGGGSSYGLRRSHWPKAAKMRRKRRPRWLPWGRR